MARTHPDRSSIEAPFKFDAEAGIKLGSLPEAFSDGATEIDRAALAAARRLGIEVKEVSLPDLPYGALMNIVYAEAAAAFEELTLDDVDDALKWQDDGAWPNTFRKVPVSLGSRPCSVGSAALPGDAGAGRSLHRGRRADRAVHDRADARRQQLHRPPLPASARGLPRSRHARRGLARVRQADCRRAQLRPAARSRFPRAFRLGDGCWKRA